MSLTDDPNNPGLKEIKENGQQASYLILSDTERAKGFVRPLRDTYYHSRCGGTTHMSRKLAETYARDPSFYGGTYCSTCQGHFPVGADGEFIWVGTPNLPDQKVGT